MKKIKNFKINLRMREVIRILKTTTPAPEITAQLEEAIQRESQRVQKIIVPAAMYDTQPREKIPPELAVVAPEYWVAASAFLITIGSDVEREIKDARDRGETILPQILHSIALESLEQSVNFVRRLIVEEAKDDECELSRNQPVGAGTAWEKFSLVLPGDKIGVTRADEETYHPLYSSCGVIFLTPLKKRAAKAH